MARSKVERCSSCGREKIQTLPKDASEQRKYQACQSVLGGMGITACRYIEEGRIRGMQEAVVLINDARFDKPEGYDWKGLDAAMAKRVRAYVYGGSWKISKKHRIRFAKEGGS